MKNPLQIRPGVLDELARETGARSDKDLAAFLGITETQLEVLRYAVPDPAAVIAFAAKAQAHRKAADLLDGVTNNETAPGTGEVA